MSASPLRRPSATRRVRVVSVTVQAVMRKLGVSWALLMIAGCAAGHGPVAIAPSEDVAAPERARLDDGLVAVTGELRASDGGPLREAHVTLQAPGVFEPQAHVAIDDRGRFEARVRPGAWVVSVAALDHAPVVRWTVLTGDVEVRGRLGSDPSSTPPRLTWAGEDAASATIHAHRERWQDALASRSVDEHHALLEEARAEVDAIEDPGERSLVRALELATFGARIDGTAPEQVLRDDLDAVLEQVSPDDVHLALLPQLDHVLPRIARGDDTRAARVDAWCARRVADNPSPSAALGGLAVRLALAEQRREPDRVAELFAGLADPRFRSLRATMALEKRFDPARVLQPGKTLPSFDYATLGRASPRITRDSRLGRLYVLEFWATWCKPCVAQMPELHRVYAAINGAKAGTSDVDLRRLRPVEHPRVEFVFVSFDADPGDVTRYRDEQWSMPWTHAFVGKDFAAVMKAMGLLGVPTVILVDEQGTILEVGESLSGDALRPTLERVLAER